MTLYPKHIVLLSCLAATTAMASNSDDDLQRALALSMEPQSQGAHQSDHFGRWLRRQPQQFAHHLTPEEEDAQIAAALARSCDAAYNHRPDAQPVESSSYACSSTRVAPHPRPAGKRPASQRIHSSRGDKAPRSYGALLNYDDDPERAGLMDPFADMPRGPWTTTPDTTHQEDNLPPLEAELSRFLPSLPALPRDIAQDAHEHWDDSLPLARARTSTQNDITVEELQIIFDDLSAGNHPSSPFFEDEE